MAINPKDIAWDDDQPDIVWDDEPQHPISTQYSGSTPAIDPAKHPYIHAAIKGTLEALPVAGMMAGGAPGLLTGPAAPVTTLAGGALGYGIGARAEKAGKVLLGMDRPETAKEAIISTGKEVATGAAYEAGGRIATEAIAAGYKHGAKPATGWVWDKTLGKLVKKLPSMSKTGIEKDAADALLKHTSKGDIYEKNIRASQLLEKRVPGLKFTRGQISNDPQAILLERSLSRKGGEAAQLTVEQRAYANQSLQDYYKKKLLSSSDDVGNLVNALKGQQTAVETNLAKATKSLEQEALRLSKSPDSQAVGKVIRDSLVEAKKSTRMRISQMYDDIPNVPVKTSGIDDTMANLRKDFIKSGDAPTDFPTGIINQIKEAISPEEIASKLLDASGKPLQKITAAEYRAFLKNPMTNMPKDIGFQELRGFRTQIREALQDANRGANPNYKLARRLGELQESVEQSIGQLEQVDGGIAKQYREASNAYRIYDKTFRKGAVGEVLRPGMESDGFRISGAEVARQFFKTGKLDTADDFMRAMGGNAEARQAIRDYAAQDLINTGLNSQTGELVSKNVHRWYAKNYGMLKKFGVTDDFKNVVNAQKLVDKAIRMNDTFNKSVAGKILNADPDKIIPQMFSGSFGKNKASVAEDLRKMVGNDPAAINGIQKSFADYLMKRSQTTGVDILENPVISFANMSKMIREYSPAIKVLYRKEPAKIKALLEIQRGYEYLGRTTKSPLGGGSDTAENLLNILTAGVAPLVTSRFAVVNAIKAFGRTFTQYNREQVNAVLTRAVFDPDYAQTLIMMSKGAPKEVIVKRLNGQLATIGLAVVDEKE